MAHVRLSEMPAFFSCVCTSFFLFAFWSGVIQESRWISRKNKLFLFQSMDGLHAIISGFLDTCRRLRRRLRASTTAFHELRGCCLCPKSALTWRRTKSPLLLHTNLRFSEIGVDQNNSIRWQFPWQSSNWINFGGAFYLGLCRVPYIRGLEIFF